VEKLYLCYIFKLCLWIKCNYFFLIFGIFSNFFDDFYELSVITKKFIVVHFSKTHDKVLCLSCAFVKRPAKFYVCRAFCGGTRQSFMFAVRFMQAHDKVSKKYEFLTSLYLCTTNTLLCIIYFNSVLISTSFLFLMNFFHWNDFFV
jgi:hypothetical protein